MVIYIGQLIIGICKFIGFIQNFEGGKGGRGGTDDGVGGKEYTQNHKTDCVL